MAVTLDGTTGITTPSLTGDVTGNLIGTGASTIPTGTTAQRPVSPVVGMQRYNTDITSVEIYTGIYWANVTTVTYPVATGGIITTDGDYKVHTFTSSSNFIVSNLVLTAPFQYLVVAGGGSGGNQHGGGGGGGGFLTGTLSLGDATYPITVGAGGAVAGAASSPPRGTSGSNSVFNSITSIGGGAGGAYRDHLSGGVQNGDSGGSGGGGGPREGAPIGGGGTGGAATSGQGFAGATGSYGGGGGGGSGSIGLVSAGCKDVCALDGKSSRLVHQPSTLVGSSDPGMVSQR